LNKHGVTEGKLKRVGLSHASLLAELGLTDEYAAWRRTTFTYRGEQKPAWNWARAIEVARELVEQYGDLPTVEWCRVNSYSQLTNVVHGVDRTWEDLRIAIGLPPTIHQGGRPRYFESRSGIRWRSYPETCLSNFLYARGIRHWRGNRYPEDYKEQFGRAQGHYDLHFDSLSGEQIDVEIWGNLPDKFTRGGYAALRKDKELYHQTRVNFLGIECEDCLSDGRLTELLKPYVGVTAPFRFDKPQDRLIETCHWSGADEILETCRQIAASTPDGVFPNEQWLRKRGKYANRPGDSYNTLAIYINTKLGGIRNVRELLGQSEASTIKWIPESVVAAWVQFEATHGLTPAHCHGHRRDGGNLAVIREGARIYAVAHRLGLLDQIRAGRAGRKRKWTEERVRTEWNAFVIETGRTPTQCMSRFQRARLPRAVTDRATRIYQAGSRLGIRVRSVSVTKTNCRSV